MHEMRPVYRLHQDTFGDEILDIRDELGRLLTMLPELVDDALVATSVRRDTMRLVDNDKVCLGNGVRQNILCPHTRGQQDFIAIEGRAGIRYRQLADPVFGLKRLFELFEQHQPVAQHDDLLVLVEPLDDLAGKHGLAGTGRCLENEAAILTYDRRKPVDNLLLPGPEMHQLGYQRDSVVHRKRNETGIGSATVIVPE